MNTHDSWEYIHRKKDWGAYPSEHVIRFVARNYYKLQRDSVRILDFGCGTGANTWYLAREGFDTYAFDISETAINKLDERLKDNCLCAHTLVCDGIELPYKENFFDAVIDNVSILCNKINEIKLMYTDVYRMLKPGGRFLSIVFDKNTTGYGTGIEIEPGTYENLTEGPLQKLGCRHFFDKNEMNDLLKKTGFKNINIEILNYTDKGNRISQLIGSGEKQ